MLNVTHYQRNVVPWTARRSNQSILKEISLEYSLEGLMLKLKLQYFAHLLQRTDSLEKTLMLGRFKTGREGDDRGPDGWMASLAQCTWFWVNSGSWQWTAKPGMLQSVHVVTKCQTLLRNLTELNWLYFPAPEFLFYSFFYNFFLIFYILIVFYSIPLVFLSMFSFRSLSILR